MITQVALKPKLHPSNLSVFLFGKTVVLAYRMKQSVLLMFKELQIHL